MKLPTSLQYAVSDSYASYCVFNAGILGNTRNTGCAGNTVNAGITGISANLRVHCSSVIYADATQPHPLATDYCCH